MIECPSCRAAFDRQPKFCENCGYGFAASPPPLPASLPLSKIAPAKRGNRIWKWIFGTFAVLWFLLLAVSLRNTAPTRERDSSPTPDPARREVDTSVTQTANIGDTFSVVPNAATKLWACAPSEDLYRVVESERAGGRSLLHAIGSTKSVGVDAGMEVQVLEARGRLRKVRILTDNDGRPYGKDKDGLFNDNRIGRDCWLAEAALTPVTRSSGVQAGDTRSVRSYDDGYWPCASEQLHYQELVGLSRTREGGELDVDSQSLKLALARTKSVMVEAGTKVKVLETGTRLDKVRVQAAGASHECWISDRALKR